MTEVKKETVREFVDRAIKASKAHGYRPGQAAYNCMAFSELGATADQIAFATGVVPDTRQRLNPFSDDSRLEAFLDAAVARGVLKEDRVKFVPRKLPKSELDAAFEEGRVRAEKLRAQTAGMTRRPFAPDVWRCFKTMPPDNTHGAVLPVEVTNGKDVWMSDTNRLTDTGEPIWWRYPKDKPVDYEARCKELEAEVSVLRAAMPKWRKDTSWFASEQQHNLVGEWGTCNVFYNSYKTGTGLPPWECRLPTTVKQVTGPVLSKWTMEEAMCVVTDALGLPPCEVVGD